MALVCHYDQILCAAMLNRHMSDLPRSADRKSVGPGFKSRSPYVRGRGRDPFWPASAPVGRLAPGATRASRRRGPGHGWGVANADGAGPDSSGASSPASNTHPSATATPRHRPAAERLRFRRIQSVLRAVIRRRTRSAPKPITMAANRIPSPNNHGGTGAHGPLPIVTV